MRRIAKGRIEKHYCDKCGKNIYDHIPKGTSFKLFGMDVPEYGVRVHIKYVHTRGKEYCETCYDSLKRR